MPADARGAEASAPRALRLLACLIGTLAAASAAAALLLGALNGLDLAAAVGSFLASSALSAITFGCVGAVIASFRPRHPIGWLFCFAGLGSGLQALAGQYAQYTLITRPDILGGGVVAVWANRWLFIAGLVVPVTYLLLLFPDGRLPSPRWRWVAWTIAGCDIAWAVLLAVNPNPFQGLPPVPNPVGLEAVRSLIGPALAAGSLAAAAGVLAGVAAVVARFGRVRGEARQQLKWLAYAGAVLCVTLALSAVLRSSGLVPVDLQLWVRLAEALAIQALPLAAGVAILRYRLYDIDFLINRSLVYTALTACVVGVYVLVVGYLGMSFQPHGDLVSLLAAGIVAVLFQPLRDRLQRAVNRVLYGQRDEPYVVLSNLARRLETALVPAAVLPAIVGTIREALRLPYVAIVQREGRRDIVAAESGNVATNTQRLPLVFQQEAVGELLLAPRAPGETFTPGDRRLLDDLARQAGVAVHTVRLNTTLQQARASLVAAREEERRRIRRDLHDGLGPQLASLALTIDVARTLLKSDLQSADELLLDLRQQSQAAVADIRRLVYDLRPPALDDLGLVSALREHVGQHARTGLRIEIDVPQPLTPLPAAVEVAAYRIVQEALTNVTRHAHARTCIVRLGVSSGPRPCLEVLVQDDGQGLPDGYHAGMGLTSLRERTEELGGEHTIESTPGSGTRIMARLPLGEREEL
jgi:two-component system NarL family sensor kinase